MNEFRFGSNAFALGKKTYIMGILNVTPDSFSDGGKYITVYDALKKTESMIEDGADIIDIGAVSTRPFATEVSEEEEWRRLSNVIEEIRKRFSVPLSADTFNCFVAKKCIDSGVDIINDVSGVFNPEMADIIKRHGTGWIVMHSGVLVKKSEEESYFPDGIVCDVNSFFDGFVADALKNGIELQRLCLDPGFGFAKDVSQNIELLKNSEQLNKHGCALLCALSRKRFIGELTGEAVSENRDEGSLAANMLACMKGADIIRVHNTCLHKKAFTVFDSLFR